MFLVKMYGLQLLFSSNYYIYCSIYHQEEINYDIFTHTLVAFITVGPYRNEGNTVYVKNFAEGLKENHVF